MMNVKFPCKDCPNKGCGSFHSQCEPYQEAMKRNEELKAERDKNRETRDYVHENHKRIERYIRHSRRGGH